MADDTECSGFLQATKAEELGPPKEESPALEIRSNGVLSGRNETPAKMPRYWNTRKLIKTFFIYAGYLCMGMQNVMLGATLLEVQIQTGLEIDQLSSLVTWTSVGCILGSLLGGAIFDRFHAEFQLAVGFSVGTAAAICFPLLKNYYLISVDMFMQGFSMSFITIGGFSCMFSAWAKNPGPFFQALMCTFSLGYMLAPLVAKPFLTPDLEASVLENGTSLLRNGINATTANHGREATSTSVPFIYVSFSESPYPSSKKFHPGSFYPYLIIAICQVIPSIYFYIHFALDKCQLRRPQSPKVDKRSKLITRRRLPILLLFILLFFFPCGIEMIFGSLLNTYVVKHLNWSVDTANSLLTTFWAVYLITRGLGILLSNYISARIILAYCISVMTLSLVVMAIFAHVVVAMWASAVVVSTAVALLFSNCMLYAEDFFDISASLSSVLVSTCYAGVMCMPALAGYLFDNVDMQWYVYLTLGLSIVMGLDFVVINIVGKKYKRVMKPQPADWDNDGEDKKVDKQLKSIDRELDVK